MLKDWDYTYLDEALVNDANGATIAEARIAISRMSKEIKRLQSMVYLKPSEITTFGKYRMFRTDDEDNQEGVLCNIVQGPDNFFFLIDYVTEECQNILTLDPEVRFQKV